MANVFQEGEPLNVTSLNEMYTELVKLRGNFGSMTSAGEIVDSILGPTVPVIAAYREAIDVKKGVVSTLSIYDKLSKTYNGKTESPIIIAGLGGQLSSGQTASVSVHGSGLQKTLYLTTNFDRNDFGVYWVAVYLKPINNN